MQLRREPPWGCGVTSLLLKWCRATATLRGADRALADDVLVAAVAAGVR